MNSLGIFEPKPFTQIPSEDWLRFFEVNVLSGVRLSRFYLPGMLKRNWDSIVFIFSESALNIPVEMIHYGVTKTAQVSLARGLAEMLAGTSVTVNSVLPDRSAARVLTDFCKRWRKLRGGTAALKKEFFRSVRPPSLLKRFATPQEVAPMVGKLDSRSAPDRRRQDTTPYVDSITLVITPRQTRRGATHSLKGKCRPEVILAPRDALRAICSQVTQQLMQPRDHSSL